MKRFNGVSVALALFGCVNFLDALLHFGGDAVDLPPVAFYAFSLWILVRNTVGHTLLMSAPAYFLGRRSRLPLALVFCYVVLIEAATRYSDSVFHADLATVWLQLLQNSSCEEMAAFVKMSANWRSVAGLFALMSVMAAGSVLLWRAAYPKISRRSFFAGCLFCLPFLLANCLFIGGLAGNWKFGIAQMKYTQFVLGTIRSITEMRGINRACDQPNLPEKLRVGVAGDEMPDGVFVLGESSTRSNWHLYGYPRQTTPRMDALYANGELVRFDDVVGTQPDTVSALSLLLTDVQFDDRAHGSWTLAEAYRRAGYRCILISNQYSWGDTSSTLYKIFNGCEKRTSPRIEFGEGRHYDESLVSILEGEFKNSEVRPTIVFLHLAGIHYPVKPECVHPPEDAHFTDDVDTEFMRQFTPHVRDRLNRYDDGVLYEDKVLGMIVDVLRKRKRPSFMFFMSDHGESPRSETWRSYADEDVYELPAILWLSPSYKTMFRDFASSLKTAESRHMQPDEMTYGLLELGFIRDVPIPQGRASFLSGDFSGRTPRLVDKGRKAYSRD